MSKSTEERFNSGDSGASAVGRISMFRTKGDFVGIMFLAGALAQLALNFLLPSLSNSLGIAIAVACVWIARIELYPALLFCQFVRTNFVLDGYGSSHFLAAHASASSLSIGGVSLTVNYAIGLAVFFRVVFELFSRPATFREVRLSYLVFVWIMTVIPAVVMCYLGRQAMNPSFTGPLRVVLMAGALFYGIIVGRRWPRDTRMAIRVTCILFFLLFGLAVFGGFHHRILWIMVGFAVPILWIQLRRRTPVDWILGSLSALAAMLYCSGIGPGLRRVEDAGFEGGLLGTTSSTFTLNAIFLISCIFVAIASFRKGVMRKAAAYFLGWPSFLVIVVFSVTIAMLSPHFANSFRMANRAWITDLSLVERFEAKLFDDRSVIWGGALADITEAPFFAKPAGGGFWVDHPVWGRTLWMVGAHNTILEILATQRWVNGSILLGMLLIVMVRCSRVLATATSATTRALAAGTLAGATVGATTGHYLLSDDASFWFLSVAGIVVVIGRQSHSAIRSPTCDRFARP